MHPLWKLIFTSTRPCAKVKKDWQMTTEIVQYHKESRTSQQKLDLMQGHKKASSSFIEFHSGSKVDGPWLDMDQLDLNPSHIDLPMKGSSTSAWEMMVGKSILVILMWGTMASWHLLGWGKWRKKKEKIQPGGGGVVETRTRTFVFFEFHEKLEGVGRGPAP